MGTVRDGLKALVAGFEPGTLTGAEAVEAVRVATEMENLVRVLKAMAARRVDEANAWRASGSRSAAQFLAGMTGGSAGELGRMVDTARKLESLGPTGDAVRAGAVSIDQA